jgi:hypothetical protein
MSYSFALKGRYIFFQALLENQGMIHQLRKVADVKAHHYGLNAWAKACLELLGLLFLIWNEVYIKP